MFSYGQIITCWKEKQEIFWFDRVMTVWSHALHRPSTQWLNFDTAYSTLSQPALGRFSREATHIEHNGPLGEHPCSDGLSLDCSGQMSLGKTNRTWRKLAASDGKSCYASCRRRSQGCVWLRSALRRSRRWRRGCGSCSEHSFWWASRTWLGRVACWCGECLQYSKQQDCNAARTPSVATGMRPSFQHLQSLENSYSVWIEFGSSLQQGRNNPRGPPLIGSLCYRGVSTDPFFSKTCRSGRKFDMLMTPTVVGRLFYSETGLTHSWRTDLH